MMTIKISTSFKKKRSRKGNTTNLVKGDDICTVWSLESLVAKTIGVSPCSGGPEWLDTEISASAANQGIFWGRRDPLCVQLLSTSAMVFRAVLDGIPQFMTPSSST